METTDDNNLVTSSKVTPTIPPHEIEIVIASYKENLWYLDFLKEKGYKTTIYNTYEHGPLSFNICKETKRPFNFKSVDFISLPNIAREAGQYLHHMISRKGSYSPYTFFMQADLGYSHENNFSENLGADSPSIVKLLSWLEIVPKAPFMPYQRTETPPDWTRSDVVDDWNNFLKPFKVPPITTPQTVGAQFMCSKEMLDRIPIDLLNHLLNLCHEHGHPFAYKLEYAWPFVLDCFGQIYPIKETVHSDQKLKSPMEPFNVAL
jgi:hypothetical protein